MPGPRNPYRILCLDGGGRWSLISVMALQAIFGECAKGHDILQGFDLVAANSGGSIVLGGLVENKSLAELLDLFCTSERLFPQEPLFTPAGLGHWLSRRFLHFGPKYDTATKLERLTEDVSLLVKFARAWLNDQVGNQPIRENPYTFEPRIGHTTFSQARDAWMKRERF